MLDCWNEHPEDRPTFNELREKFSALLLAGKEGLYIDLQVDEMKPYYVIKEDEEEQFKRRRVDFASLEESTTSIEKTTPHDGMKVISRTNTYVVEPDSRRQEKTQTEALAHLEEQEEHPYADQPASRPRERGERPNDLGISIAMLASVQPNHDTVDQHTTNLYADGPVITPIPSNKAVGEESEVVAEVHILFDT